MKPVPGKHKTGKWKDSYYVKSFQLAKTGLSDFQVAKALGVTWKSFKKWLQVRPSLRAALDSAREQETDTGGTMTDRMYLNLPDELRWKWDEIWEAEKNQNHVAVIESLLADTGKRGRQHLFLYALVNSHFNLSEACRLVNVPKSTFDRWCTTDPAFLELTEEIQWQKKNLVEGALMKLVKEGDTAAVLFAAKTLNRDRGYDTKIVVDHNHNGTVRHEHEAGPDLLAKLSVAARKELLAAVRGPEEQLALPAHQSQEYEDAEIVTNEEE